MSSTHDADQRLGPNTRNASSGRSEVRASRDQGFRGENEKLNHSEVIKCRLLRLHLTYQDNLSLFTGAAFGGWVVMVDLAEENEILGIAIAWRGRTFPEPPI